MNFSSPTAAATTLSLGLLLISLSAPSRSTAGTTTHYEIPGDDVAIYDLIGEIRIEPGTGNQVAVDVTTEGSDAGRLRVETGNKDGHSGLRVIYPGDRFVYNQWGEHSSTTVTTRDDGTFGGSWSGRRVRISGKGPGLDAHADLTILVPENRTVTVHLGVGQARASRVSAKLRIDTMSASVNSQDTRGTLSIDVGSGNVQVHGMEGPLDVDTGSGSVEIVNVNGRQLRVDTGSGSVSGSEISAEVVYVDTGSGSIELGAVDARDIRLDTGSGSVEIDLVDDVQKLIVDTGSGGVRIGVPANLGAGIQVDTGSGGINVGVPHQAFRSRRSSFQGQLGDGNGRIVVDTGSGGVDIVSADRAQR